MVGLNLLVVGRMGVDSDLRGVEVGRSGVGVGMVGVEVCRSGVGVVLISRYSTWKLIEII